MELMDELENMILDDMTIDEVDDTSTATISDWDIISRLKKGSDKINNQNIVLLENLKLDPVVFKTALNYYQNTVDAFTHKRLKYKNSIMCACVFLAFSARNDHREEKSLMDYFSTDKIKYTKGLKLVKTAITEVRSIKNCFDNEFFTICRKLNVLDDITDIKDYIDNTISHVIDTPSERKKSNALIYIWLIRNRKIIPTIPIFADICNTSQVLLRKSLIKNYKLYQDIIVSYMDISIKPFLTSFKNYKAQAYPEIIVSNLCKKLLL